MKYLRHLSYFSVLEITHSTDGLYNTQAKYTSKLLSRAGLTNNKTVDTQVELNAYLTPSWGKLLSNPSFYRWLVGSLVYLIVTLPKISYVVHQVSQYLSALRSTHYIVVLCILRYLKGTLPWPFLLCSISLHSLMLIGQEIPLIVGPPLVIAFFSVLLWFLGEARNKPLWPALVLKQNIMPLLIPYLSSFGYDDF